MKTLQPFRQSFVVVLLQITGIVMLFFGDYAFLFGCLLVVIAGIIGLSKHSRYKKAVRMYKTKAWEEGTFFFPLEDRTAVLLECEKGEEVNFWQPSDDKSKAFFFQKGTAAGEGKLGQAPKEYVKFINEILKAGRKIKPKVYGDEIQIEIIDIDKALGKNRISQ